MTRGRQVPPAHRRSERTVRSCKGHAAGGSATWSRSKARRCIPAGSGVGNVVVDELLGDQSMSSDRSMPASIGALPLVRVSLTMRPFVPDPPSLAVCQIHNEPLPGRVQVCWTV